MRHPKKVCDLAPLLVMVLEQLYSNPYVRTVLENKCNFAVFVDDGFFNHHRPDGVVPIMHYFRLFLEGADIKHHFLLLLATGSAQALQPLQFRSRLFGEVLLLFKVGFLGLGRGCVFLDCRLYQFGNHLGFFKLPFNISVQCSEIISRARHASHCLMICARSCIIRL